MISKRVISELHGDDPYLIRWSLWLPIGLSLKLHRILRHDEDRCPHDHPWWFVRVILWGGYWETCGADNRLMHTSTTAATAVKQIDGGVVFMVRKEVRK